MLDLRWIAIAIVVPLVAPVVTASTNASNCEPYTYAAIEVSGHYMYGTAHEFWKESNGIPGLQRTQTFCSSADGSITRIPEDTCITHSENGRKVPCALSFATSIYA